MIKIPIEKAFSAFFHTKLQFNEFLELDVDDNYTEVFISKNTFSPSKKLRLLQKFLNHFLIDFMNVNKRVVYSYREGVSAYHALVPHQKNQYFFTTDIEHFFTSIHSDDIEKVILQNLDNFSIVPEDVMKYKDRIVELLTFNHILPIGAPSSPKLTNAIFFDLDNKLESYCQKSNISYTRYSDDFIFSSNNEFFANHLKYELQSLLETKYIKLNQKKSKFKSQGRSSKVKILGMTITPSGHITLDKKMKSNIEVILFFYLNNREKYLNFLQNKFENNIDKVYGYMSYINEVDKDFILKLRSKYGNYIIDAFLSRSINE